MLFILLEIYITILNVNLKITLGTDKNNLITRRIIMSNFVKVLVGIPCVLFILFMALVGDQRYRRFLKYQKSVNKDEKNIKRMLKTHPHLFFNFEGILCAIDPGFVQRGCGLSQVNYFTAAAHAMNKGMIFVTQAPDMTNPHHVAILQHEVGHIKLGHVTKVRNYCISNGVENVVFPEYEYEADVYAASIVGEDVTVSALEYILTQMGDDAQKSIINHRIKKLRWSNL